MEDIVEGQLNNDIASVTVIPVIDEKRGACLPSRMLECESLTSQCSQSILTTGSTANQRGCCLT